MFWKASSLEWAVVQSFSTVEPGVSVWWKQFEGWTQGELQTACFGTDDVDVTSRRMFQDASTKAKMIAYVGSFTGAQIALEDPWSFLPQNTRYDSLTVDQVVKEWSEGMDPVIYVVMMKARIESMAHAIIRLKNTNNIFRSEIQAYKQQIADLNFRLRFLKKGKIHGK